MSKCWPDDFPKGCPPENANNIECGLYRLVDSIPPTSMDFIRTRDSEKHAGKDFKGDALINSFGTSMHTDPQDAWKLKKKFKNVMKNKKLALGAVTENIGKVAQTYTPSHHTAWFYEGSEPEKHFTVEVEDK